MGDKETHQSVFPQVYGLYILLAMIFSIHSPGQHTKRFVVSQPITNTRLVRWEIQHDSTFIPVGTIRRAVSHLAKKVKVWLPELDVDAAPVGRCHKFELLGLIVKELANPLEHRIGLCDRKRKL